MPQALAPARKNRMKLFVGFIFAKQDSYLKAKHILERKFGQVDFESQNIPFNHTRYYEKEFGINLQRKFLSSKKLIKAETLARIKIITNRAEKTLSRHGKRQINIDPGILNLSKVILATTKDYSHRIPLTAGIYAEATLCFQNRNFHPWPWTYPDYKTPEYIQIFNTIREIYFKQIKN